jgi:hypothetical protein
MVAYRDGLLALDRTRRGGRQTVRVVHQHVAVAPGGQAVVAGSMKAGAGAAGGGRNGNDAATSYQAARMAEEWQPARRSVQSDSLRGQDSQRAPLPRPSDAERAVQDARLPLDWSQDAGGQRAIEAGQPENMVATRARPRRSGASRALWYGSCATCCGRQAHDGRPDGHALSRRKGWIFLTSAVLAAPLAGQGRRRPCQSRASGPDSLRTFPLPMRALAPLVRANRRCHDG